MPSNKQTAAALLRGDDLRQMFIAGRSCLEMNVEVINVLNVFPVPDGDTGTNMLLTLKAVDEEFTGYEGAGAGILAQAIAQATLMGARGNSGVILSQFFKGWAQALEGLDTFGGPDLSNVLEYASDAAYKAVSKPVEGTILTVVREAARAAREAVASGEESPIRVWELACESAHAALAETPELLPVLKEAGVVDAGGLGLVTLMDGVCAYLKGEEVASLSVDIGQAAPSTSYLTSTQEDLYGYCTQLLLHGTDIDVESVRSHMAGMASSAVVVGDASVVKVHVHTDDPGAVISYAVSIGDISQVGIDNMDSQHKEFMELHHDSQPSVVQVGIVAVASGDGIQQVFRELGALAIVSGGQTMNPSIRELVDQVAQAKAAEVIMLPNNPNIVSTAQQAALLSSKPLHVVATTSIPQGVAALLALNPDLDVATNMAQMRVAIKGVQSGEVTIASRSTSLNGVRVRKGQAIALLEGELVASTDDVSEVLQQLCLRACPAPGTLITLYWGEDIHKQDALAAAELVRSCCPGVEVELVCGGQPHYSYLMSIE